jgi:hypothetical protein
MLSSILTFWTTFAPLVLFLQTLFEITVQDGTGAIRIASHSHGCSPYRKDPLSGGLCASKDRVVGYVCTSIVVRMYLSLIIWGFGNLQKRYCLGGVPSPR